MRPISQEVGLLANLLVFNAGVSLQGNTPDARFILLITKQTPKGRFRASIE